MLKQRSFSCWKRRHCAWAALVVVVVTAGGSVLGSLGRAPAPSAQQLLRTQSVSAPVPPPAAFGVGGAHESDGGPPRMEGAAGSEAAARVRGRPSTGRAVAVPRGGAHQQPVPGPGRDATGEKEEEEEDSTRHPDAAPSTPLPQGAYDLVVIGIMTTASFHAKALIDWRVWGSASRSRVVVVTDDAAGREEMREYTDKRTGKTVRRPVVRIENPLPLDEISASGGHVWPTTCGSDHDISLSCKVCAAAAYSHRACAQDMRAPRVACSLVFLSCVFWRRVCSCWFLRCARQGRWHRRSTSF